MYGVLLVRALLRLSVCFAWRAPRIWDCGRTGRNGLIDQSQKRTKTRNTPQSIIQKMKDKDKWVWAAGKDLSPSYTHARTGE
jgi:hypothetical protein